jgi:hypothetical protein
MTDPDGSDRDARLSEVGEAFHSARISLAEAAERLSLHVVDAVALLEMHGFSRSIEALAFSEEERRVIYARMRADRLARGGIPQWSAESVARETIASERLAGVDARARIPLRR